MAIAHESLESFEALALQTEPEARVAYLPGCEPEIPASHKDFYDRTEFFALMHADVLPEGACYVWQQPEAEDGSSISLIFDISGCADGQYRWQLIKAGAEGRQAFRVDIAEKEASVVKLNWDHAGCAIGEETQDEENASEVMALIAACLVSPDAKEDISNSQAKRRQARKALNAFKFDGKAKFAPELFQKKLTTYQEQARKAGLVAFTGVWGSPSLPPLSDHERRLSLAEMTNKNVALEHELGIYQLDLVWTE